jgi:hypothetical protein
MKKVLVLLLTLVLAVGVALPVAPVYARQAVAVGDPLSPTGTVYAVVIGISDYPGHPLGFPTADAEAFQSALTSKYNVPTGNIQLLEDATKPEILAAITSLGSGPNDDVIIYFSGHGTTAPRSLHGIVAVDYGVIWSSELRVAIQGMTAKRVAVILDCCYAKGFADDLNLENVLAMMSSAGLSWETSLFGHGIFTYWFVQKGIIGGLADNPVENRYAKPDGMIPFEEAFDYAFQHMTHEKPKVVDNVQFDFYPSLLPSP